MNSFVSTNTRNQPFNEICSSVSENLVSNSFRIGIWDNGVLSWEYPFRDDFYLVNNGILSIPSMSSTSDYEIINLRIANEKTLSKHIKIIVQYHNVFSKNSMAFYSPNENAIIYFLDNTVTMIGGLLNGKGMRQYSIQEMNSSSTSDFLRCLEHGSLPLSWLAKGEVCSTFTLETKLSSGEKSDGKIWSFHATSSDLVRTLKNSILQQII